MRSLGKKPLAFLVLGIVLVTGLSLFWVSNRTQFRFEEWNPHA